MREIKETEHLTPERLSPREQFQKGWEKLVALQDKTSRDKSVIKKQDLSIAKDLREALLNMETALPSTTLEPKTWYPLLHYYTKWFADEFRAVNEDGKACKEAFTQNIRVEMKLRELTKETETPIQMQQKFAGAFGHITEVAHKIKSGFGGELKWDKENPSHLYTSFRDTEALGLALGIPPRELYRILDLHAETIASYMYLPRSRGSYADFQSLAKRYREITEALR